MTILQMFNSLNYHTYHTYHNNTTTTTIPSTIQVAKLYIQKYIIPTLYCRYTIIHITEIQHYVAINKYTYRVGDTGAILIRTGQL